MCDKHLHDEMGDDHMSANLETPLRADAFELSAEEKVEKIEADFRNIMETLGLDLTCCENVRKRDFWWFITRA